MFSFGFTLSGGALLVKSERRITRRAGATL
jgi:hypothetical protein